MKKILNIFRVIRNNWKKSAFAAGAVSYGVNYGKDSYDTRQMMRRYCEEACKYGDEPNPLSKRHRIITVILNPSANKRKSKDLYEKYCAPLLHLAGVSVNVVQTEFAGQAKDLPEVLDPKTDAILIAGGDGTLAETVTGLFRRAEGNLQSLSTLPIAVLPLGRTNSVANAIVGDLKQARALAKATMAVIDGTLRQVDVIKIESLEGDGKPVFSLARIEWGAHRDIRARRDKFWMVGPWREYLAYLMAGAVSSDSWVCQYSDPCRGCLRCSPPVVTMGRWWQSFVPKPKIAPHLLVENEDCGNLKEKTITTSNFSITTSTVDDDVEHPITKEPFTFHVPHMKFNVGHEKLGRFALASEGFSKVQGIQPTPVEIMPVRQLKLFPPKEEEKLEEKWFSIDSEDFEMRPISLTLLPKSLHIFEPRRDRRL